MKKEGLFELIETLSVSEKRYFKAFAKTHGKKQTKALQLFELITESKKNDETQILTTLGYQDNLNGFSVLKNYLFQLIIKSLRSHHNENDVRIELNEILLNISILYPKKLYVTCNKLIDKGIKIAEQADYFNHLLLLLRWKIKVGRKGIFLGNNYYDSIKNILNQEAEILEVCKNINFYHLTLQEYLSNTWKKDIFKQTTEDGLPALPIHLTDISNAKTFDAKFYYHATRLEYFQYKEMIDEQLTEALAIVDLFEKNPQFIKKNTDIYVLTIGIISILYLNKRAFNQLVIWRERLVNIKSKDSESTAIKNLFILLNELRIEIFTPSEKLPDDVINRTDKFLAKEDWLPGIKDIYLIFNVIILLYKHKEFDRALKWQRKYDKKIKKPQIKFYTLRIYILELIIRYEMGNMRLLESLVNNAYNYMHRNNALSDENVLLISFFKKLVKEKNTEAQKALFAKLVKDIKAIQKTTQLYFIIQFLDFDFLEWATARS